MKIDASYQPLSNVLQKTSQNYIVPLFQRRYSWTDKECEVLWDDLMYILDGVDTSKSHFVGAVVLQEKGTLQGLNRSLIIDGQQRLTTFTLLIAAIRDRFKEIDAPGSICAKIEELLACPNYKDTGIPLEGFGGLCEGYFRIQPSNHDKMDYYSIIFGKAFENKPPSLVYSAYALFKDKLKNFDAKKLNKCYELLIQNMGLVVITLQNTDNPYTVFSSLNQKGLRLTIADLIRNHLFEQIPENQQKAFYDDYMKPTEDVFEELKKKLSEKRKWLKANKYYGKLGDAEADYMSEFIYRFWAAKKSEIVPKNRLVDSIISEVKGVKAARAFMERMKIYSRFYASFILPDFESNIKVRLALEDIQRTGETTFYPLLMELFGMRHDGNINDDVLTQMIRAIENVLVRRKLYGVGVTGANKEFPKVIDKMAGRTTVEALVLGMLSVGAYPTDAEIMHAAIDAEFYGGGKNDYLRLILIQLNRSYKHDFGTHYHDVDIEHILPQNNEKWWKHMADDERNKLQNFPSIVHRLGNLTIINQLYDKKISNEYFNPIKRDEYKKSPYTLTQELAKWDNFTLSTIEARTKAMLERLLYTVYPNLAATYGIELAALKAPKAKSKKLLQLFVGGIPAPLSKYTWKEALLYVMENVIIAKHPGVYLAYKLKRPNEFHLTNPELFSRLSTGDWFRTTMSAKDAQVTIAELIEMAGLGGDYVKFVMEEKV